MANKTQSKPAGAPNEAAASPAPSRTSACGRMNVGAPVNSLEMDDETARADEVVLR